MFRILGEMNAFFVVLFDKSLDESTYSELGNVIASQTVSHLNTQEGMDLMISPPKVVTEEQFSKLLMNGNQVIRKTYAHICGNVVIPVETLILPIVTEEMGYA